MLYRDRKNKTKNRTHHGTVTAMLRTNLNHVYALKIAPHIPKPLTTTRVAQARAPQRAYEEINNTALTGSQSSESDDYDEEAAAASVGDTSSDADTDDRKTQRRVSRSATAAAAAKTKKMNRKRAATTTKSAVYTRERQMIKETTTLETIDISDSEESSSSSDADSDDSDHSKKNNNNNTKSKAPGKKPPSKRGRSDSAVAAAAVTATGNEKKRKPNEPDVYVSHAEFYTTEGRATMRSLRQALSEVMCQEDAIEQVIYKLHAQALTPFRPAKPSDRICSLHLTGGSGVGKTETTRLLARYLGVGEGTRYTAQYRPISLSKYSDQSHAVALTGAAAGLLGHDNIDLVTQLIQAAARVDPDQDVPFIVLGLDEACKAHPAFMNSLNPLLSDGSIANVREQVFTIPRGTLLIILWTSNFAEHICEPYADPEETTRYIYDRMRRKGYDNCDIARMGGDPIVYSPLSHSAMYTILERCGNARLGNHTFSRDYGVPRYQGPPTESVHNNSLILNILSTYKVELGVRHPLEKYKIAIEALLTTAVDVIECAEEARGITTKLQLFDEDGDSAMLQGGPVYWCAQESLSIDDCADPERLCQAHPSVAAAISQNRRNRRVFEIIVKKAQQQKQESLDCEYVTLRFRDHRGQTRNAYSVLQPSPPLRVSNDDNNNNNNDDDDDDDVVMMRSLCAQIQCIEHRLNEFASQFELSDANAAKQAGQLQILLKNQFTLQSQLGTLKFSAVDSQ